MELMLAQSSCDTPESIRLLYVKVKLLRESQISYIGDNYCFTEGLGLRLGAWCAISASNLLPLLIHQDTPINVHHSERHA
jgi:hypothetical protein